MTHVATHPTSTTTERATVQARSARASAAHVLDSVPFRWTRREAHTLPVEVHGSVPAWLRGQLVRTAPAVFDVGSWQAAHWFDGLGLLYGFSIDDAGVRFTQRALDSAAGREIARGGRKTASFDTAMQRNWLQRLVAPVPPSTDNANVNVVPWQGGWLAMTETPHQHVIDAGDLASRGLYAYEDSLPDAMSMTAHPHFDFQRNAMVNVGITFGPKSELWVLRHEASGRVREVEGKLALKRMPYVHDFGLTPRHAVVIGHPYDVSALSLLFSNRGFIEHFRWQPEQGTHLWVLDRARGTWTEYQTDPLFCFHTVNAFDDGDDVVLDMVAYDDPSVIASLTTDRVQRGLPTLSTRYVRARMRPGKKHAELTTLSDARFEFPSIPYRAQHGHAYETAWGASLLEDGHGGIATEIVRVDLARASVARFAEPGVIHGEPIFVPRPGATRADDGVLLSVGSDVAAERSVLTVLDATQLEPLARCEVPLSLPLGFHGNFKSA
ncbi:MAG: carotenoid oxygenase family protein [Polyangiales bacterium]